MNTAKVPAEAIPIYASVGEDAASIPEVEKANNKSLKEACNEFLFRWVPPTMTILEFEQVSCGLFARITEEWEKRDKAR